MINKKDYACERCDGDGQQRGMIGGGSFHLPICEHCHGTGLSEDARAGLEIIRAMREGKISVQLPEEEGYFYYDNKESSFQLFDSKGEGYSFDSALSALTALIGRNEE